MHNEKLLLREIAEGDLPAFRRFFDLYRDRLYIFVEQLTHSRADAEEIIQDTFLKVWESAPLLSRLDEPRNYIYTIARNKTLNYLRKIARDKQLVYQAWACQSDLDNSLEESLRSLECRELIEKAVRSLSPQKQTVFRLSREEHLSHAEIAARLGLSQSRVKNILVEALKHIKSYLQEYSDLLAILFWIFYGRHLF